MTWSLVWPWFFRRLSPLQSSFGCPAPFQTSRTNTCLQFFANGNTSSERPTPTNAAAMPMKFSTRNGVSVMNATRGSKVHLHALNFPAPCQPRSVFPVNTRAWFRGCVSPQPTQFAFGKPPTRWVIGGSNLNGVVAGTTRNNHFVVTSDKPFATTNLTAKVSFSRVLMNGGKFVDATKFVNVSLTPL